jgi:dipeptidyl-peptidase 4
MSRGQPGPPGARLGAMVAVASLLEQLARTRRFTLGVPAQFTITRDGAAVLFLRSRAGDDVLFTASEEPTQTHLWRYRPAEGIQRLTAEPGVHSGVRRGGTLVHVAGGAGQPGGRVRVLRESAGSVRTDCLDSLSERAELTPRPAMLVLGPRRLRAMLFLPSWHGPGSGKLPVLEDQVTAVREAARLHPDLDLGRAGIRGWSFGGCLPRRRGRSGCHRPAAV